MNDKQKSEFIKNELNELIEKLIRSSFDFSYTEEDIQTEWFFKLTLKKISMIEIELEGIKSSCIERYKKIGIQVEKIIGINHPSS